MALGESGWTNSVVARGRSVLLDLVFWTFTGRRPNGHVGVLWGNGRVTHASSKRGVVVDLLQGYLLETLTQVVRLNIGD